MVLRLYDTHTRAIRDFEPLEPGKVTMYVCGATVQSPPHVGHVRFAVNFDVLGSWLTHEGFEVSYARNVTDIDDKVLAKSAEAGVPWWAHAYRHEIAFSEAYDLLGCAKPSIEPRATGHLPEIIAIIQRLVDSGHAYASGGDVLFDVGSHPDYGALSGQRIDELEPAGDTENASAKRDPRDFALWKGAKPGEPTWESPWGPGRPGWHVECSAMATKYLGRAFDIHGGGIDLVFPHHENERAQSQAAGDPFARFWLHNAWVTMSGEKMSKSLGNDLRVAEVVKRGVRAVELRYYLVSPHYRSMIEYSDDSLREAAAAYHRLESFAEHAVELLGEDVAAPIEGEPELPADFVAAMDDDLGTPQALAVVFSAVREGNTALATDDKDNVRSRLAQVRAMLSVLGLDPLDPRWRRTGSKDAELRGVVDGLVQAMLEQREEARARKDWATADAVRHRLRAIGVELTDTPSGTRWSLKK